MISSGKQVEWKLGKLTAFLDSLHLLCGTGTSTVDIVGFFFLPICHYSHVARSQQGKHIGSMSLFSIKVRKTMMKVIDKIRDQSQLLQSVNEL